MPNSIQYSYRWNNWLINWFWWCSFGSRKSCEQNLPKSKNNVYIGEPVQVTVSVFTSSWFTKGVNPGNIKANGAFTVYFRSLSTSKQVNGKIYAGVQLFFNVFPYENKNIEFPALEIKVETPDLSVIRAFGILLKPTLELSMYNPIQNWVC